MVRPRGIRGMAPFQRRWWPRYKWYFLLVLCALLVVYKLLLTSGAPPSFPLHARYATSIRYLWTKSLVVAADVHEGISSTNDSGNEVRDSRGGYKVEDDLMYFREDSDAVSSSFVENLVRALSRYESRTQNPDARNPTARRPIVYLATEAIPYFISNVLPAMESRFAKGSIVLVSGCTDPGPLLATVRHLKGNVGAEAVRHLSNQSEVLQYLLRLLDSPLLYRYFAQNCDVHHPKVACVPIGIDYHTMSVSSPPEAPEVQDGTLIAAAQNSLPWASRVKKVFLDFNVNTNKGLRGSLYYKFAMSSFVSYPLTGLKRPSLWEEYSKYAFVMSPPGNGYDCHRTWEALALGAVPIVLDSAQHLGNDKANELFRDLPVVIVHSYNEVTQENINRWYDEIAAHRRESGYYVMDKLFNKYWLSQILKVAQA